MWWLRCCFACFFCGCESRFDVLLLYLVLFGFGVWFWVWSFLVLNWCAGMRVFLFVLCCFDCSNLCVDVVCDVCVLLFVLIGVLWYCMVSCNVLVVC